MALADSSDWNYATIYTKWGGLQWSAQGWVLLLLLIRGYWEIRIRYCSTRQVEEVTECGGRLKAACTLVLFGVLLTAGSRLSNTHTADDGWAWNYWDEPTWIYLLGLGVGYASALSLWPIHSHLAHNWSPIISEHRDHELVTTGPYAFCRHPMYAMIGATSLAAVLNFYPSLLMVACFASWMLYFCLVRVPAEDALMARLFGDQHARWKEVTPAILPYGPLYRLCRPPNPEQINPANLVVQGV